MLGFINKILRKLNVSRNNKSPIASWHEYYTDANKVRVVIRYSFTIPSRVQNFNFDTKYFKVKQQGSNVTVLFNRMISSKLLFDLQKHFSDFRRNRETDKDLIQRNPSQYIVGFVKDTLPYINDRISNLRYREGHLILRNISIFDVHDLFVFDDKKSPCAVLWPLTLPNLENIPEEINVVFVRDLIDAMSEYFYFNLDECIRKVITSLENYFIYYKLEPGQKPPDSKFLRKIRDHISEKVYPFKERDLSIVRDNISFVYNVRGDIVHNKLRLNKNETVFCKKAIGTLLYIYQSKYTNEDGKARHIFSIDMHFKMLTDLIAPNLDLFEKAEKNQNNIEIINNDDEFNQSIFSSLQIKDEEKQKIMSGSV